MAAWVDQGKAKVDLWLKEIAPSTELRKWFGHDPKKWRSFRERYQTELKHHADDLELLKSLFYGAKTCPISFVNEAKGISATNGVASPGLGQEQAPHCAPDLRRA
ncbi:MAG TPA: DUF488 family protein [Chthoniobacterales bacterium]